MTTDVDETDCNTKYDNGASTAALIEVSVTSNEASSATQTTVTHVAGARPLVVGDTVTVAGHSANAAHLAMNQAFTVQSVTSPTVVVLTGTGMTAATYVPEQVSVSSNVAASATETTITHVAGSKALNVGDFVTISGHTGDAANLAMNQVYTVKAPGLIEVSVTSNEASSATQTTVTHVAGARPLVVGDTVTVAGHSANAAHLAMNQAFTVQSVTSPTVVVLTGTGMTAATYVPEQVSVSSNVAASATETTITHVAGSKALNVGDTLTISGHTGDAANTAMNQVYTVQTVTDATHAVLTGTGMTAATYNSGTIIATFFVGASFSMADATHAVLTGVGMTAATYNSGTIIATFFVGASFSVSSYGNLCHVECSNRGTCNHLEGICTCYNGYYGDACQTMSSLAQWVDA